MSSDIGMAYDWMSKIGKVIQWISAVKGDERSRDRWFSGRVNPRERSGVMATTCKYLSVRRPPENCRKTPGDMDSWRLTMILKRAGVCEES